MRPRSPTIALFSLATLSLLACGSIAPPRAKAPEVPAQLGKCRVTASHQNPLVTEWPASEKANLDARMHEGAVVVAYTGCEMRLLAQCKVPGKYHWQRTTPATDAMEIQNEDDLYARLPLGAAALEGELRSTGRLSMQTTVGGQARLQGLTPTQVPITGLCAGATHVVAGLTLGAFTLKSGGALEASAAGGVPVLGGAGASTTSQEVVVRQAGNDALCGQSTDEAAHPQCRSPIQMFLWPLPAAQPPQGPPGTANVSFVAGDANTSWQVLTGNQLICDTPCAQWLPPHLPITMREREVGFLQQRNEVVVPRLSETVGAGGSAEVRAHTRSNGGIAGGVTMITFGGLGIAAGITFLAVGCPNDKSEGLCTAGAITLPASVALLLPGIWLTSESGAKAEVSPRASATAPTRASAFDPAIKVGPGNVTGIF